MDGEVFVVTFSYILYWFWNGMKLHLVDIPVQYGYMQVLEKDGYGSGGKKKAGLFYYYLYLT